MRTARLQNHDCIYCGDTATCRDHVRAYSFDKSIKKRMTSDYKKTKVVPSCDECNSLLHNAAIFSIPKRAAYLYERVLVRHAKLLRSPVWTTEEIEELSTTLQAHVRQAQHAKKLVLARLDVLQSRAGIENVAPESCW